MQVAPLKYDIFVQPRLHAQNSSLGDIAEEVGDDDESFDGDFSDVEDTHPATNDEDSFDDDDGGLLLTVCIVTELCCWSSALYLNVCVNSSQSTQTMTGLTMKTTLAGQVGFSSLFASLACSSTRHLLERVQ